MTQDTALSILQTGANVFLTGEPGAGKTYVINQYITWLEAANLAVAVTASTGIAATHIGGMTIHSWSGVGARDTLTMMDLDKISTNEKVVRRIKKTDVLIIDEISMLDGKLLDMVEVVCRTVRATSEPFGGLQIVLVGDFFQLPPVTRNGDMMRYAFESHAWNNTRPLTCYLHEQYRQEDETLLALLSSIRRGDIEEEHYNLLKEQTEIAFTEIEPTRLYTHNADVDSVNLTQLNALSGKGKTFKMSGRGSKPRLESLTKQCLSPDVLTLKEEALVMCTKNNFEAGYVNGTLARVVEFDSYEGYPVIETADKRRITVKPQSWDMVEDGKVLASIEQLPLRLAWAITVHKSQGMSLDAIEVDLSKAFVYGQGYVALSRVRSLAGLKVLGMHPNALQVDPKVIARDQLFRQDSEAAEETFGELDTTELQKLHTQFVVAHGGRLPSSEAIAAVVDRTPKAPEESTQVKTVALIKAGKSLAEAAAARDLTEGTILNHVEEMVPTGAFTQADILNLITHPKPTAVAAAVAAAIAEHGDEKLRPLYEATGEVYDYTDIRLARLLWRLAEQGETDF